MNFIFNLFRRIKSREVVKLKPEDIDSERMLIHVVQGKGRKDRFTVLSQITLNQLRKYFMLYET